MNLNPFYVIPIPGAVNVTFAQDFEIQVSFIDSSTGQLLLDCSSPGKTVLMSQLLSSMPADALFELVYEQAARMVEIAKGVPNG